MSTLKHSTLSALNRYADASDVSAVPNAVLCGAVHGNYISCTAASPAKHT